MAKLLLLFFGGLGTFFFLLLHPAGAAIFVFAITPFDSILWNLFGHAGNLVTVLPLLIFLMRPTPGGWIGAFLGTRVQRATALLMGVMVVPHLLVVSVYGLGTMLVYLQKVALFLLLGVMASGLRDPRHAKLCGQGLVLSMAAFGLLSMADFYLGLQLLPVGTGDWGAGGLVAGADEYTRANDYRLVGLGGLEPNQFGLALVMALGLAGGWVLHSETRGFLGRPLALAAGAILSMTLIATISRSGIGGAGVGLAVVLVLVFRVQPGRLVLLAAVTFIVFQGAWFLIGTIGLGGAVEERFSTEAVSAMGNVRVVRWIHGLRLFADAPLFGVGYGQLGTPNVPALSAGSDPHNAYVRQLAWGGIVGFLAWAYWYFVVLTTLLRRPVGLGDGVARWQPFYLAAFLGMSFCNIFVSQMYVRYMFMPAAFAVVLERARSAHRVAAARDRLEAASAAPGGWTPPDPPVRDGAPPSGLAGSARRAGH